LYHKEKGMKNVFSNLKSLHIASFVHLYNKHLYIINNTVDLLDCQEKTDGNFPSAD